MELFWPVTISALLVIVKVKEYAFMAEHKHIFVAN